MSREAHAPFCERLGVRFPWATHLVLGFEHQREAERYLSEMKERFAKFGLGLHPEKTRLIEFGRYAEERRARRGEGKPGTFDFLGFTHCCSRTRTGEFMIRRQTHKKRMRATLKAIRETLKRRRHEPVALVGSWLKRKVQGYFNYFAVPGNLERLSSFRREVGRAWRQALKRRSQRGRMTWSRFERLIQRYVPVVRQLHPHPLERFRVRT